MDKRQKFESFLESLKENGQDTLIESVKKGFNICMEGVSNIRLGNEYDIQILASTSGFIHKEIPPNEGFVKSYIISNRPNSQLFRSVLNIMADGRAIENVNYTSYSGVKEKHTNYFDKNGKEIIDSSNSSIKERRYFDNL